MQFVDEAPFDDAEFDANGWARNCSPAEGDLDGLSYIMHELGHALGFDFLIQQYFDCICVCSDCTSSCCLVSEESCQVGSRAWICPDQDPPVAVVNGPHLDPAILGQDNAVMAGGSAGLPGGKRNNVTWREVEILATAYPNCYINLMTECDCPDDGGDCNGIPQCVNRGCSYANVIPPACDDQELCTFDECCCEQSPCAPTCTHTASIYADVAGSGGSCGPDGIVDLLDIFAVLDAFAGSYADFCAQHNLDIAGDGGSCDPNGTIDLSDILAVLDAFEGMDNCCSAPAPAPLSASECLASSFDPIVVLDPHPIQATAGGPIVGYDVDVHVYGHGALTGYQVGLELAGEHATHAVISEISVDHGKPTFVFAGSPRSHRHMGIDLKGLRMAGALRARGIGRRSYLMRFRIERAADAPEAFSVTLQTTAQTQIVAPNGCTKSPPIVVQQFDFE